MVTSFLSLKSRPKIIYCIRANVNLYWLSQMLTRLSVTPLTPSSRYTPKSIESKTQEYLTLTNLWHWLDLAGMKRICDIKQRLRLRLHSHTQHISWQHVWEWTRKLTITLSITQRFSQVQCWKRLSTAMQQDSTAATVTHRHFPPSTLIIS